MILGVVEHDRGTLAELSLEMLTFARRLAAQLGVRLEAALIGTRARSAIDRLAAHGVERIHVAEHEALSDYAPEAWAQSVVELMRASGPRVVLAAGSDRGHEVMAHVAARTALPLAANCIEVEPGDPFVVIRHRWGGTLLEEARMSGEVALMTLAAHAVPAEEAPAADVEVEAFTPTLADGDLRVRVTARTEAASDRASLGEAKVVVGGGRGVGGEDGFSALEELADLLGGTVGCSRPVTSAGWRPHTDQIGQTGTRIAPDLYIACGISGATQHWVGCKGAKRILVVNTDRDAPIFAHADYAVVGDVRQVIPALAAEIRRYRGD